MLIGLSAFRLPAIKLIRTQISRLFESKLFLLNSMVFNGTRAMSTPHRRPIEILETDIEEKFVKGSGPVNKTSSAVQLVHKPTGIRIETQRFRGLADNRREARKLLKLRLDELYNGEQSKTALKIAKKKKQKAKQKQRAKKKKGEIESQESENEVDESVTEENDPSVNAKSDPPSTSTPTSQR